MALINFTVHTKGTTPDEFQKKIDMQFISIKDGVAKLANDARNFMVQIIKVNKKRPGGRENLENTIQVEKVTDEDYGIGNIALLQKQAPYWRILNYGGMVSPKAQVVPGFFGNGNPPQYGGGGEEFFYVPGRKAGVNYNSFFMTVSNPIAPVNYIHYTQVWLNTVIRVHLSGWTNYTRAYSR